MKLKKFIKSVLNSLIVIIMYSALGTYAGEGEKTVGYYFGFGGVLFNTDRMENQLTSAGFETPKDWAYTIGGGFYGRKRLVVEAEINGLLWKPRELGVNETRLYGISSSLNLGINVLPLDLPMALYPYIGSGFGRTRLLLNQTSADFGDAVATPPTSFTMKQRNYAFRSGIGYDFTTSRRKGPKKRFLSVGFRMGYMFDVTDNDDWESDEVEIQNGPKLKTSGFYGKVVIGKSFKKFWHKGKGPCCEKVNS